MKKSLLLLFILLFIFSFNLSGQNYSLQFNGIDDHTGTQSVFSQPGHRDTDLKPSASSFNEHSFNHQQQPVLHKMKSGDENSKADFYRPFQAVTDERRHTYTFDSNGNELFAVIEEWSDGNWVNYVRWSYTYDSRGNQLTEMHELWDNGTWRNNRKTSSTYDINDNRLTVLIEDWSNSSWVNVDRSTYTYDNNSNELTLLNENWSGGNWVNDFRKSSTYGSNHNKLTMLEEDWTNNNWVNESKYTYIYNNDGDLSNLIMEDWLNSAWINDWRTTYNYDNTRNLLSYLYEDWSSNTWVNGWRYTYTYDNNQNVLIRLFENWESGSWVNEAKYTYTYDNNANRLSNLNEEWLNGAWLKFSLSTYQYVNGNATRGDSYYWDNNAWVPGDSYLYMYYDNMNYYIDIYGEWAVVIYDFFTDVNDFSGNKIAYSLKQNYPNPFNPSTTIQFSIPEDVQNIKLIIYSALGEKIAELVNTGLQAGNYKYPWNANRFASGIYIYQLVTEKFVSTKKMMLLK